MDAALIQAKINYGYSKVAQFLGTVCDQYRPVNSNNVVTPLAHVGTQLVRFDPRPNFSALQASQYGKPIWYGAFDRTLSNVGDYFVQQDNIDGVQPETFFVAGEQSLIPTMLVQCNAMISLAHPSDPSPGVDYYGGEISPPVNYLIDCPVSLLEGPKGVTSVANLPDDSRAPWYKVLLPAIAGIDIETFDVMTDEAGVVYTISSLEITPLGYRLTCGYSLA